MVRSNLALEYYSATLKESTHTHTQCKGFRLHTDGNVSRVPKKVPDPNMNRHGAELYFAKCRIKMAFLGFFLDIPQVNGENGNCFVSKMDLSQQQRPLIQAESF